MATLDFAWLLYFSSVFGFVFIWVFLFALFVKTKILGENNFISSIIALIFALIFISFTPGVKYLIATVMPWFVILIVALFFLMMVVAFSQKEMDKFMKPWLAWVFIGLMVVIFLFSAVKIFNPELAPYLPGGSESGADPTLIAVKNLVYSQEFLGAVLIAVIVVVLWRLLVKGK